MAHSFKDKTLEMMSTTYTPIVEASIVEMEWLRDTMADLNAPLQSDDPFSQDSAAGHLPMLCSTSEVHGKDAADSLDEEADRIPGSALEPSTPA